MIATAWTIGAGFGLICGFFLAAMLLYREPIKTETKEDETHGDWPYVERR